MAKFGATEEVLEGIREQFRQRSKNSVFEVWPENWRAFELFTASGRQWIMHMRSGPMGASGGPWYQGLDHSRVLSTARLLPPDPRWPVPGRRELFHQLRTLEEAALPILNSER